MSRPTPEPPARLEADASEAEVRERLHATLDALPDLLFELDRDGVVYDYRVPPHTRLFAPPEVFLGRPPEEYLPPQVLSAVRTAIDAALERGRHAGTTYTMEVDGAARWYELSLAPKGDPQAPDVRLIALVRDITGRVRAEEAGRELLKKMQHTQRLESLGVLAGGIAHDFNNILTAILGNVSLSRHDHDRCPDCLDQIELSATRAAELCDQLLAYAGKGRLAPRPTDLSRAVRDTTGLLELGLSKKAHLELRLGEGLPAVDGDLSQLTQVILNLVVNSSEALGDQPGRILVTTRVVDVEGVPEALPEALPPGRYVVLEVEDDGPGMDAAIAARIFEPFFTTRFQGRGLGLAATLGIVRRHGGGLVVRTEPGLGTTVRVLLPASAGVAATPEPAPPREEWTGGGGRVLLVDDEAAVRRVTARLLTRLGLEVVLAEDGARAVEIFAAQPQDFDLVLMDLTMPRVDGVEAFEAMRALRSDVQVVLCSGFSTEDTASRFAGLGLAGFLHKPFTTRELERLLQEVLAPHQGSAL